MRVRRIDEFTFKDIEEPSVIEKIGRPLGEEVPALDEHMLGSESVDHLCRTASIGQ